ncbi:BrkDBD domain containing protein [Trichuris trichiura]|uniref:BrkDBD domain containing protein n=1 Tax=Trichuris trichiura TaxID=36087 RepID=A0A077ZA47_TRITR|nr:BrkDBD domain containing protein [Trichuris trichiura]
MRSLTRSYKAGFKLEVVKMAKETNNAQAARKYGVTPKMVIDWKNQGEALKKMPKKKRASRSGIASWPELENGLAEWDREQRQNGRIITRTDMKDEVRPLKPTLILRLYRNDWMVQLFHEKGRPHPETKDENCTANACGFGG